MTDLLLRRALSANALFSGISGVALITLSIPLSNVFDLPAWLLILVGAGLLPFAVTVARTARDPEPAAVRTVIAADAAWVVVASVVLIGFGSSMATAAVVALGVVTIVVADFAVLQFVGLRRAQAATS